MVCSIDGKVVGKKDCQEKGEGLGEGRENKPLRSYFTFNVTQFRCWEKLFSFFNQSWVFGADFRGNIQQPFVGVQFRKIPQSLWVYVVKSLSAELWFERNQRVYHDKSFVWLDRFEVTRKNASSWCSFSKPFESYCIQEIYSNWRVLYFQLNLLDLSLISFCTF